VPWTLAISSAATVLAALLVVAVSASARRDGGADEAFRAFCFALVVAGVASALIGLVQVFAPHAPDGSWIAIASIPGRATGNLRQPNHLSSLLLWSLVAVVWLSETKALDRRIVLGCGVAFIYVVVLTGSRTGALGMLTLAGWGLLDRRLSRRARTLLILAPVLYVLMWWLTSLWAAQSHQVFGGETRFTPGENFSSSRTAIWANALALIASHPWLGVGFGNFNFAWTLTPFPGRPTEFFDHTHDIVLNFAVEMGLPLAALVLALMTYALWRALCNAISEGRDAAKPYPVQRAAFVIVLLVAVHSMLEYPLWYAYFLLPTAFAFGLCLERPRIPQPVTAAETETPGVARPYVIASMLLMLFATLALYDYMRVVVIFAPPAGAGSLEQRIAEGRKSVLFGHHADYAAATVAEHPGEVMAAFKRAPHYLLDARLMMAWAKALEERGETDKARYVAARLREFHSEQTADFFAPCPPGAPVVSTAPSLPSAVKAPSSAAAAAEPSAPSPAASAPAALPFQCLAPTRPLRFENFR
jgi:O-antigen ligase